MPRLFERVLVLRGGGAAVDRVEGGLLLAGRGGYLGGAGLFGEGITDYSFEEEFRVLILGSGHLALFKAPALFRTFFEGGIFPSVRIQGGDDAGGALAGIEARQP